MLSRKFIPLGMHHSGRYAGQGKKLVGIRAKGLQQQQISVAILGKLNDPNLISFQKV